MNVRNLLYSLLCVLALSGCKTLQVGGTPMSDANISPLQTFSVTPPNGAYNLIALAPEDMKQLTVNAVSEQLTDKGYRRVAATESPDFIVNTQWMISTQNNPEILRNPGSVYTDDNIPVTQQVASLDVYVISGENGSRLWRNSSPWPFSVRFATEADIENAAAWALESFPTQQAKLEASTTE